MQFLIALSVAASAFNLNCTGTKTIDTWEGFKRTELDKQAVSHVLRVNLGDGLWCSGDCTGTSKIATVDDATITFNMHKDDVGDEVTVVNRRTGALIMRERVFLPPTGSMVTLVEGTCQRAVFSGFPTKKF